jgi:hypothetical protein
MALNLANIRAGLAANLATVPGLAVSAYYDQTANNVPPIGLIRPNPETLIDYHESMRNGVEIAHMLVEVFAGAQGDVNAQQALDGYVASSGTSSVRAALESDRTLGGACQDLIVIECRSYTDYTRPDAATLVGAQWVVDVLA